MMGWDGMGWGWGWDGKGGGGRETRLPFLGQSKRSLIAGKDFQSENLTFPCGIDC